VSSFTLQTERSLALNTEQSVSYAMPSLAYGLSASSYEFLSRAATLGDNAARDEGAGGGAARASTIGESFCALELGDVKEE
jgi:hypothetical protein